MILLGLEILVGTYVSTLYGQQINNKMGFK